MTDTFDNAHRLGDAITFVIKHKPFVDLGIPPTANDYRDAACVTIAIYDTSLKEKLLLAEDMKRVPNKPGWYFYRYQTTVAMKPGVYTAVITAVTRIDGQDLTTRSVKEFRLINDGVF